MALESFDGPIGQHRNDQHAGLIAQVLYAVNGKGKALFECMNHWDQEEWEEFQRMKLKQTFTGRA